MSIQIIFIELVVGYFALFLSTKLLGKTQISQITPFDFVSALVLGEFVGNAVYQEEISLFHILFGISIWVLLIFSTEFITQKSNVLRTFFEGQPSILVRHGQLDWSELKRNHLDIDQLMQLLRTRDVFSLQEVEYAILENNGTISVLKKSLVATPTRGDLKLAEEPVFIPFIIISDGCLRHDILRQAHIQEDWLYDELQKRGIMHVKEVCFAEVIEGKELYVQTYVNPN